jgi:hypothetical protein
LYELVRELYLKVLKEDVPFMASITNEIKTPGSEINRWLDAHFPMLQTITQDLRPYQRQPLSIPCYLKGAWPSNIGTAAEYGILREIGVVTLAGSITAGLCSRGYANADGAVRAIEHTDEWIHVLSEVMCQIEPPPVAFYLVLTKLNNIFRAGSEYEREFLNAFDQAPPNLDGLQSLYAFFPKEAIQDVQAIIAGAGEAIAQWRDQPIQANPAFAGSRILSGDGDIIIGTTLVDIKCISPSSIEKHATQYIKQLIAYTLHDSDDAYRLTDVAIYLARHQSLVSWSLADIAARSGLTLGWPEARSQWMLMLQEQFKRSR